MTKPLFRAIMKFEGILNFSAFGMFLGLNTDGISFSLDLCVSVVSFSYVGVVIFRLLEFSTMRPWTG